MELNYKETFESRIREQIRKNMEEILASEIELAKIRLGEKLKEFAAQSAINLAHWAGLCVSRNKTMITVSRYGRKAGPFWWNYNLSAAVRFNDEVGVEVRWWGITIGRWGFGIMRRMR